VATLVRGGRGPAGGAEWGAVSMNYEPKPSSALGYFSGRLCGGNSPPVAAGDLLPWPRAVYSQKHHYPWEVRICTSPGRVLQVAFFKTWQLRFGVFLGCAGAGLGSPALGRPEEQAENRALENRHFPDSIRICNSMQVETSFTLLR
jgi:hypothetical protein